MSLQTAFRSAQTALSTNAIQTSTVARNVSGANSPGYARKIALVESAYSVSGNTARVSRATDFALQRSALDAGATARGAETIAAALETLQSIFGDPANGASPSARITQLKTALLHAAAAPQDDTGLSAAVGAAQSLASALRDATGAIQGVRNEADRDMAVAVANVNSLLKSFEATNESIVAGQALQRDVTDLQDKRDMLLSDLAKEISISIIPESNGGVSIFTDSGVALFQGAARVVSMETTAAFAPGVEGRAIYIDGVAVTGPAATMRLHGGALAGLEKIRGGISASLQSQIDEIAVGLISAFSQSAASPASTSVRTGLFAWSGSPDLPPHIENGAAWSIRVDASVADDPRLLRDGGIGNDPTYVSNPLGAVGYSSGLYALVDALDAVQSFAAMELPSNLSVMGLAVQSEAWFQGLRQAAADEWTNAGAELTQFEAALSNATGVNIDDQMSQMLDLENSYQAAAKMMATVDTMYAALFNAVNPR